MTELEKIQEQLRRVQDLLSLARAKVDLAKSAGLRRTGADRRELATLSSLEQRLVEQAHDLTHKGRW